MATGLRASAWAKTFERSFAALTRQTVRASTRAVSRALKPAIQKRIAPPGAGDWIAGVALGAARISHVVNS